MTIINTQDNTFTARISVINGNSDQWNNTYTTVNSNSGSWGVGGISIGTVQTYLSSNNVLLKGTTVTGDISASGNLTVNGNTMLGNISASGAINALSSNVGIVVNSKTGSYTLTNDDNNRIIHFNTSTQTLSAIIPESLRTDFNCAVMNTGTNFLVLSTYKTLRATGTTITSQYGAAFVYKDSANNVYAVGRL